MNRPFWVSVACVGNGLTTEMAKLPTHVQNKNIDVPNLFKQWQWQITAAIILNSTVGNTSAGEYKWLAYKRF